MRNPFSRKKAFDPIPEARVMMTLSALVGTMFPDIDASKKSHLIRASRGTVYACVQFIANDFAMVPVNLYTIKTSGKPTRSVSQTTKSFMLSKASGVNYRLRKDMDVEQIEAHEAIDLLETVNDYSDGYGLKNLTTQHQCLVGDAYWWVRPKTTQTPLDIHILEPDQVDIIPSKTEFRTINKYKYGDTMIEPEEVIHFKYPNPSDPFKYGMSPLESIIDEYNLAGKLRALLADLAKNKSGMMMYIERLADKLPYTKEQADSIKSSVANMRTGNISVDDIMILSQGDKLTEIPNQNKDMPFDANFKMLRELICNAFQVPVSLLTESSTRATQTTQRVQYFESCIQPKIISYVQTLNSYYLPMFNAGKPVMDMYFMAENCVPNDEKLQMEVETGWIRGGVKTPNEVRLELNLKSDPNGDILYSPASMTPAGQEPVGGPITNEAKALADGIIKELEGSRDA